MRGEMRVMKESQENQFLQSIKEHAGLNIWIFALASKVLDPYFMECIDERLWEDAAVSILASFLGFMVFFAVSITVLDMFMKRKGRRFGKFESIAMAGLVFLIFMAAYFVVNEVLFT